MKMPRHGSLQNRCVSALSSLPHVSHFAIGDSLRISVRSWGGYVKMLLAPVAS
jgi:hypothetical protein